MPAHGDDRPPSEAGLLVLGQGVGAAAEPVRDVADGRRGRRQRLPRGAVPGEVVADDGIAAVVAEGLDLAEQGPDAAAGAVGVLAEVGLERVELAGRGPCQRPSTSSCQVAARSRRWTVCSPQPRWRAISRRPRPSARSPWTSSWCRRVRSAYFPAGPGGPVPSGSGRAGPCSSRPAGGAGSARQARWAATHFSTALARFCHRWNLSATWTASGAPVLAPSNGTVRY